MAADGPPRIDPRFPTARGVLKLAAGQKRFATELHRPASRLEDLVEHYWSVRWDLRGQDPVLHHTLSNPSCHLVVEAGRSHVQGVVTGRFSRLLEGAGLVFGVKFRPAGFRPFLAAPVSGLADRSVPVGEVLGPEGERLVEELLALAEVAAMAELADDFLLRRLPAADASIALVNGIVARIFEDRRIVKVDDVVSLSGIGKRRLQRLFSEYVGVSPKWVIQRYRLYEAVDRLAEGNVDLATLAQELGYFDQAHFANDFKAIVGEPPAAYARSASDSL